MTEFMAMMWVMCLAGFLLLAIDVLSEPFPSQQFLEEAREPAMVECLRHVRRSLHEFPELKWEEEQTSALYGKSLTGLVRQVEMLQGVTVTRSELDVDGKDIERVCRYCAFINQKCHVKNKDIRKYLDGIYVSDKGTIDVE